MAVDGRLNFDTKIDTKGFSKNLKGLGNQIGSLTGILLKMGAAIGVAFSAKEAVEAAANINAANSQLTQTFGNLKSQAKSAMKSVADNSGIVETRLQSVGTSIYAFAKTAGMDSATALNMMQDALVVTADQAAYYDRSLEDTAESLKSFLKGNFENDAALGISCTETTRNAAANKLYSKSFAELSESQKQLTLLQMVKDANALSGAEGQAAREADGWENVTGNLRESWRQLLAVVGQPILSVAVDVVKNMTSALQRMTTIANSAVKSLADVFGIELTNTTDSVSSSSATAAENYSDMADSAEQAQKAQEKSLASFDKINKISDSDSSGSSAPTTASGAISSGTITASADVDTSKADRKLTAFFNRVKSSFKTLFEPLKSAWDKNGGSLIDSIHVSFDSILGLLGEIGGSFAAVWTNGTGEQIVGNYLQIWTNINETIGNIADRLKTAWTTDNLGTDIVQHAADIWNTILEHVNNITGQISDWSATVDFTPMLAAFDSIETALQPFADNVGEGLEWFFENVLLPLAGWTIEDVIPSFLDLLSDAIDGINSVWDAAEPVVMRLWDDFLSPIASWAADTAVNAINGIGDGIKKICGNVTSKDVENLAKLAAGIGAIIAVAKGKQAIDNISKSFAGLKGSIKTGLSGLNQPVTASLGTVALAIQAAIAGWTIGTWIYDTFGDEIDTVLYPIYDAFVACWNAIATFFTETVPQFFTDLWTEICNVFSDGWNAVATFVTETVPQFFSDLWESIKNVFSAVGEWFAGLFTTAWNGIKTAWSGVKQWFADLWTNIKNIFSAVGNWFKEIFSKAWNGIKGAWSGVKQWFSDLWGNIKGVFASVGSWFSTKFTEAWENIKSAFSSTAKFFSGLWTEIKKPFVSIAKWFKDKFTDAWEAVKGVFSKGGKIFDGIKEGISGVFTSVVNKLIDGINVIIAKPLEFLNGVLNDIKDIEVAGVTPFSGFWDYDPIPVPQIPKLATGAYVPANYGEFLAVLGDNKREAEIIAPESKLQAAVEKAMQKYVGSGGDIVIHYTVDIDGKILHKEIVRVNKNETKRTGTNPMTDF